MVLRQSLIVFGFPCSGKTSTGERAAYLLGCPFIDTDREIEKKFYQETGLFLDCRTITQSYGLAFFRDLETRVVTELSSYSRSLIALGGATILLEKNRRYLMPFGHLVYLKAPIASLVDRNLSRIPLPTYLDPEDPLGSLEQLYVSRESQYQQYAQSTIDTNGLSITDVADELIKIAEDSHGE